MKSMFRAIYRTPFEENNEKALLEPNAKVVVVAISIEKIITTLQPIEAKTTEAIVLAAKAIEPKIVEVEARVAKKPKLSLFARKKGKLDLTSNMLVVEN